MLRQEGLVTERPTRGLVVRELNRTEVEDLFDMREALEVTSCRLAAQRATEDDLRTLKSLLDQSREATARGDVEEALDANGKFHDEISRIARNDLLRAVLEPLHGRLQWLFRQTTDLEQLCTQHEELLDAIASADTWMAAQEAEKHVRTSRHSTLRALFQQTSSPRAASG